LRFAELYSGITPTELRRLLYDFADINNKKKSFNTAIKQAIKDWLAVS
jgi:hypothetical protein